MQHSLQLVVTSIIAILLFPVQSSISLSPVYWLSCPLSSNSPGSPCKSPPSSPRPPIPCKTPSMISACSREVRPFCDFSDILRRPVIIAEVEEVSLRAEDVAEDVLEEVEAWDGEREGGESGRRSRSISSCRRAFLSVNGVSKWAFIGFLIGIPRG